MMNERVQLNVRIPADLHRQLEAVAAERLVSKQLLVESALTDFLARLGPVDEAVRVDGT